MKVEELSHKSMGADQRQDAWCLPCCATSTLRVSKITTKNVMPEKGVGHTSRITEHLQFGFQLPTFDHLSTSLCIITSHITSILQPQGQPPSLRSDPA